MIIWINGAFGSGKTTAAFELHRRIPGSFIYDPENIGYFFRKNLPASLTEGDFQDIPLWREFNYKILKLISKEENIIIVPMTLVNPAYYTEIITRLINEGVEVKHFILYACRKTLLKRLKFRSAGWLGRESFAIKSIPRCLNAFDNFITEHKIITDNLSVDSIVKIIAQKSGIPIRADNRSNFRKMFDRYFVLAKHIRK